MKRYLSFVVLILLFFQNISHSAYNLDSARNYFSGLENIIADFTQIDYNNSQVRYGKIYIKNNKQIKITYDNAFILYNGQSIVYVNLALNEVTYLPNHNQFINILTGKAFLNNQNYKISEEGNILNFILNLQEGSIYLTFNTKPSLYIKSVEILTDDLEMLISLYNIKNQIIPNKEFVFKDDKFLNHKNY